MTKAENTHLLCNGDITVVQSTSCLTGLDSTAFYIKITCLVLYKIVKHIIRAVMLPLS